MTETQSARYTDGETPTERTVRLMRAEWEAPWKDIVHALHKRILAGGPTNYLDGDWYLSPKQRQMVRDALAEQSDSEASS